MQRSTLRNQRTKNIARTIGIQQEEEQVVDQLDIAVDDPTDDVRGYMSAHAKMPFGFEDDEEEAAPPVGGGNSGSRDPTIRRQDGDGSPEPVSDDDDQDAEGDEEE
jgi:RNA polymerase II-associated factor 1